MSLTSEQLYNLLPAIYRIRDAEQGGPLRGLVNVIAEQAAVIEADITHLYENWFIETCDEWVVPYIGDLLGVRGLYAVEGGAAFSERGRVANTLRFRRRKGTATILEQLAHDTTGWATRAVEFFELVGWTQNFNHIRPRNHRTPDLRDTNQLELLNTAFDKIAHNVDVRRIANNRGRHNIPNVGLFLWRLQSYFLADTDARAVAAPADGRYTFSPLGIDASLFNRPQTETTITHLAEEINVPGPLRRRPLYDELEARRQAIVDRKTSVPVYFGEHPVFAVNVQANVGDPFVLVPFEQIVICNLTEPSPPVPEVWRRPQPTRNYTPSDGGPIQSLPIKLAVDPVLGRLAFPAGVVPNAVRVSCAFAFSGDLGGGPYDRGKSVAEMLAAPEPLWQVAVSKDLAPVPGQVFSTLTEAIAEWNSATRRGGVIVILDNHTYSESLTGPNRIQISEGSHLLIVGAKRLGTSAPAGTAGEKLFEPDDRRPHLLGAIAVSGTAPSSSDTPGQLSLNGLLIEGGLTVTGTGAGNLGSLQLSHCTLIPDKGGLEVSSKNERLKIRLKRVISGRVKLADSVPELFAEESVIDHAPGEAIAAPGSRVELQKCTVLGGIGARQFEAGNSICTERVTIERRQTGCMRFCYVQSNSKTPRRFRCQPDLALEGVPAAQQAAITARLVPSFNSPQYGAPAYAQLSHACAAEIRTGAEDGSEMGVFSFLKQPQRDANLRTSLDEYLCFGLEAGLIFVT
jgi:hypothetical protein